MIMLPLVDTGIGVLLGHEDGALGVDFGDSERKLCA